MSLITKIGLVLALLVGFVTYETLIAPPETHFVVSTNINDYT